jgi:hypothetical protein
MLVVGHTLDRALVAEVEVDIKSLACMEGTENLGNRLVAVTQIPGLGGFEIPAGFVQRCSEQLLAGS